MRRVAMGTLLGLVALVALLAAACAAPEASTGPGQVDRSGALQSGGSGLTQMTPRAATSTPSGYTGAPGYTYGATSTPQVMGAQATPGSAFGATPSPESMGTPETTGWGYGGTPTPGGMGAQATPATSVQFVFSEIDQFMNQLSNMANGTPTQQDLLSSVQRYASIMGDVDQSITQVSNQDREQLLSRMSDVTREMANVVQASGRQTGGCMVSPTPSFMMGTPGPSAETPITPTPFGAMATTPTAGMTNFQEMMIAIDHLRDQEMQLASNQPTCVDLVSVLGRMEQLQSEMSQRAGQMSDQDLQAVVDNITQATNDLITVMDTYARQGESGATPTSIMTP